jgi:hypothetical protein
VTEDLSSEKNWQQPSLAGLASLQIQAMPAFEVLLVDDLAAYVMGAGPLEPPYTVEHGSRVVSALFGAILNSQRYSPEQAPDVTAEISLARTEFVQGAHAFADRGVDGVVQLVNRLIPAILGELEIYKEAPEHQACSLFYYSMLAVASGPLNVLDSDAAAGVMQIFLSWDALFGSGFIPPWREVVTS